MQTEPESVTKKILPLKSFYVAGVQCRPAEIIDALGENEEIRFVAEPDNKFDANAIKIECKFTREEETTEDEANVEVTWEHIGYVPKGDTWLFHLVRHLGGHIYLSLAVNHGEATHRMLLVTTAYTSDTTLPFVCHSSQRAQ